MLIGLLQQNSMADIQIIQNTFDKSTLKAIYQILGLISFNQANTKIAQQLQEVSPKEFLWVFGKNPAYFVQYQVNSAAILRVKGLIFIVWKPKYIEYPSMIAFPRMQSKKINSLKLEITQDSTTLEYTNKNFLQFLEQFFGAFFYSDSAFQTNLVTYSKHFVSKITKVSYWHAIYEDTNKFYITQQKNMASKLKVRVYGLKDNYDKTLYLFSYKGKRQNMFTSVKDKWMQGVSFLAMVLIFYAVVACPSSSEGVTGICQYKSQMTICGFGTMMAILGLRYSKNKDKKKKMMNKMDNADNKKRD